MSEVRQCWAYSADGVRCEHPAGHPGSHVVTREWTDDECFEPIKLNRAAIQVATPVEPAPQIEKKPQPIARCVACGHSHSGGVCKCGCYEHI